MGERRRDGPEIPPQAHIAVKRASLLSYSRRGGMVAGRAGAESDAIAQWSGALDTLHRRVVDGSVRSEVRGRVRRCLVGSARSFRAQERLAVGRGDW
jgi:hypothetical protein